MFEKFYEWLGKGLFDIGLVLESIFYTAVNSLGNGLQMMIKSVTLGAVDIGKFEYQSSSYAAYAEQKNGYTDMFSQLRAAPMIRKAEKILK